MNCTWGIIKIYTINNEILKINFARVTQDVIKSKSWQSRKRMLLWRRACGAASSSPSCILKRAMSVWAWVSSSVFFFRLGSTLLRRIVDRGNSITLLLYNVTLVNKEAGKRLELARKMKAL